MAKDKTKDSRSHWKQTARKYKRCYEDVRDKYQVMYADYNRLCNLLVDMKDPERMLATIKEKTERLAHKAGQDITNLSALLLTISIELNNNMERINTATFRACAALGEALVLAKAEHEALPKEIGELAPQLTEEKETENEEV